MMAETQTFRLQGMWKIAGVVAFFIAVLTARVIVSSRSELLMGGKLLRGGEMDAAIVHYRRAARWYAPANPYSKEALIQLAMLARSAQNEGDVQRALMAWRAIRAAILSARSFYTPHRDRLEEANRQIASLMASLNPPPMDAGKSREQLRREHYALLGEPRRPRVFWTVVLLVGFGAWVGGAFAFVARALNPEGHLVPREAKRWGAVIAIGFALFVLAMTLT